MKNYTASVPTEIMQALREKGMYIKRYVPQPGVVATNVEFVPPMYAEVFDWFIENMLYVNVEILQEGFAGKINYINGSNTFADEYWEGATKSWREVANATILKALKYVDNE